MTLQEFQALYAQMQQAGGTPSPTPNPVTGYAALQPNQTQWFEQVAQGAPPGTTGQQVYDQLAKYNFEWPSHWGPAPTDATQMLGGVKGWSGASGTQTPMFNWPSTLQQPTQPGWNWDQLQAMPEDDRALAMQYYAGVLPYINSASEIEQSRRDFEELTRQWNLSRGDTLAQNQWAQGHAGAELGLSQQQQDQLNAYRQDQLRQESAQFGQTHGLSQQQQDQLYEWRMADLGQQGQQFGQTHGLASRTQDDLVRYRTDQQEVEKRGQDIGLQQSAIGTWGRREKPHARWM